MGRSFTGKLDMIDCRELIVIRGRAFQFHIKNGSAALENRIGYSSDILGPVYLHIRRLKAISTGKRKVRMNISRIKMQMTRE